MRTVSWFDCYGIAHGVRNIIESISGADVPIETIQAAGEELSEFWGRILECKMVVSRSVNILEGLQ